MEAQVLADTAINIAQRVAHAQGVRAPSSLKSNQDVDASKLLALLNRGCKNLASKRGPFGGSWQELVREHLITTQAGVPDYALPQDFAELITDTVWDRSTYREAPGPLTPQEYQRLKGGLIDTVAITPRYRLALSEDTQTVRFRLDPIPSGEETIAFEYLSKRMGAGSLPAHRSRYSGLPKIRTFRYLTTTWWSWTLPGAC